MSFSVRYTPAVLLTLFSLAATLFAQSTNTQPGKAPRGSVSGRVTIKDKGAGGIAVSLRRTEMNPYEPYVKATTDHDGFYRIANVAPGSYEVAPSAPAFVPADSQRGGKTVVVGDDESVEDINFSLVRGGVITGKVTDADGRPVILQQVNLFKADAFNQRQQSPQQPQQPVYPLTNGTTDDRGIYRIYGLRTGRYKIAVGRSDETFNTGSMQQRGGYKQVFHGDVTDHAKATIIEVAEGSEAYDVDITLGAKLQTFSASGRLVDSEKGLPIPNLMFSVQRLVGQRAEITNAPVGSNSQGEFVAEGLVPGKYQVFLYQDMNRTDLRVEPFTFEVVDQDVSNLIVKLSKGASLSGVVVIDSEDKTVLQKLTQMRLRAYPMISTGTGIVGSSSTMVAADGSFRLDGLPGGILNVQLSGTGGPFDLKGYTVSRIERDGIPMPRGIQVKDGEQIGGLRLVVAYGNGSIRGVVKFENGSLPEGVQMSVRLVKPGENLFIRPSQVDARGNFLMEGIPPGNYDLMLQFFGVGGPQQLPAVKREVSIQNGVVTVVMLAVDLATQPKP